jgi:hypothetical protein
MIGPKVRQAPVKFHITLSDFIQSEIKYKPVIYRVYGN